MQGAPVRADRVSTLEPGDEFEREAWRRGYRLVAGLDEAGRGPLAGPVVAAAVVLPRGCKVPGLNDSKLLSEEDRNRVYAEILDRAAAIGVGSASAEEIDGSNILKATQCAMVRALAALVVRPDWLLIDALTLPAVPLPQRAIIKGDRLSASIAAASIVAKVSRDRLMMDYHRTHPQYNFLAHKGYPTTEHLCLLAEHGPCIIHRRTFKPVMDCLARRGSEDSMREGLQGDLWGGRQNRTRRPSSRPRASG